MSYRKGIAAIVFRKTSKGIRFLIFHRTKNWDGWEFLKGGILNEENALSCLKREIKEETGLKKYEILKKTGKVINTSGRNISEKIIIDIMEQSMNFIL